MEKEVLGLVVPLDLRTYDDCRFNNNGDRDCKSTHCQQKQNSGLCSNYVWWEGRMPRWQPQMRARWPTRPGRGCNEICEDARKWLNIKQIGKIERLSTNRWLQRHGESLPLGQRGRLEQHEARVLDVVRVRVVDDPGDGGEPRLGVISQDKPGSVWDYIQVGKADVGVSSL